MGPIKQLAKKMAKAHADKVAVVRLEGPIGSVGMARGGLTADNLEPKLRRAFETERLKAVVLVINSPGGSPAQSEYIAERIRQLSSEKGIRVIAFCEDAAASGGYWIACAADEIYAAHTSIVGSIGVVSSGFGAPELLGRVGVERRVYTAGENKSRLDPFSAEKPEDVAWLHGLQNDLHAAFITWVRQRRGAKLVGSDAELFSGDVWVGRAAADVGLVDGIGVLRSVLAERFPDAELEIIASPKPLLTRLTGGVSRSEGRVSAMAAETFDGVVTGVLAAAERRAHWMRIGL
ncbi:MULTISPECIES: S49 family peptidase [Actinomycetes]|uniref:S49 family peptidase n=1 Tax=Actinomycetes TaxID=1760 RepID=UPI0004C0A5BB|nr:MULTISPECIES: S49 family peptidase [Actinomycetes]MCK0516499.1 S49 family peptidase [Williamsia sp. DF01-3]